MFRERGATTPQPKIPTLRTLLPLVLNIAAGRYPAHSGSIFRLSKKSWASQLENPKRS